MNDQHQPSADDKDFGTDVDRTQVFSAEDLMQLNVEDDPFMLDDISLCTFCSVTCDNTAVTKSS